MRVLRVYDAGFSLINEYFYPWGDSCSNIACDQFGLDNSAQGWSIQLLHELIDTPWEMGSGMEHPQIVPWSRIYRLYDVTAEFTQYPRPAVGWFVFFEREATI